MKRLQLDTFLAQGSEKPIIDVRSPGEYCQGHLPHSHNMPLLSDEERAVVGTLYKQKGPRPAFKKGLDFIGPKMSGFIDFAEGLGAEELLVHCWRGGNRSYSVGMLLEAYGFTVSTLEGGYKSYRRAAIDFFDQYLPLIVLTGYTGSLKTGVLHALAGMGEQVVDFEGLACHQGSAFGRQPSQVQPTSEQFQNLLYEAFRKLDLTQRIWVEDESMRIGGVNLVPALYLQKNVAPCVFLDIPRDIRLENLVKNYSSAPRESLVRATTSIQKKLGKKETQQALGHIEKGEALQAATIILKYYDKRYYKSILEKQGNFRLHLKTVDNDPESIAREILENYDRAI